MSRREMPVLRLQLLVAGVGLYESETPGRQRRPEGRRGDKDRVSVWGQVRNHEAFADSAPMRMRKQTGGDVGDKNGREREQHVLDAVEAAGQDEHADGHGGDRDADQKRNTCDLETGCDASELSGGRAEVRGDQKRSRKPAHPTAIASANDSHQSFCR